MRLTRPSSRTVIDGLNWSVALVSLLTLTGAVQLFPRSRDTESLMSVFVQGSPPSPARRVQDPCGRSAQATKIVPSGPIAAVGRLLASNPRSGLLPKLGSAFLRLKKPRVGRRSGKTSLHPSISPPSGFED